MQIRRFLMVAILVVMTLIAYAESHVIVENEVTQVICTDVRHATVKYMLCYKILDEKAADYAHLVLPFDKNHKLINFSAVFTDQSGKVIKKAKKTDMVRSEYSREMLGHVSYMMVFNYTPPVYPIMVTYEWEESFTDDVLAFPMFYPQNAYDVPVKKAFYQLTVVDSIACRYKKMNTNAEVKETSDGKGNKVWTVSVENLPSIEKEPLGQPLHELAPRIFFGPETAKYLGTTVNLKDWKQMGKWLWNIRDGKTALTEDMKSKLHSMADTCQSVKSKIDVLYKYLEQNTRYVNITLGIGGYQPVAAAEVCRTGFGDCKGLSNFMHAMLKEVGVPSSEVIISTKYDKIYKDYPNFNQFNHEILMVPMRQDTVWIECTDAKIPLGYCHMDIAGHDCLEVAAEGGKFLKVPSYKDADNREITCMEVDLQANGSAKMNFLQDSYMSEYEPLMGLIGAKEDVQREYIHHVLNKPLVTINSLEMIDDKKAYSIPHYEIRAKLEDKQYGQGKGLRLFIPVCPLHQEVSTPSNLKERQQQLVLDYGFLQEDSIIVLIPEGYVVEAIPKNIKETYPFADFTSELKLEGRKIVLYNRRLQKKGRYDKSLYADYCKYRETLDSRYSNQKIVLRKK